MEMDVGAADLWMRSERVRRQRETGRKHGVGEWGMEGRKVDRGTLRFTERSTLSKFTLPTTL